MKGKTILPVLMCCCVIAGVGLGLPVHAEAPGNRVFDQAALFTAEQAAVLEDSVEALRAEADVDAVIVTTRDARGKSAQAYADDYYDDNGFGAGKDYSGALFLIDMDNREICISTTGRMINILTDQRLDSLLDSCYAPVSNGQYAEAASVFLTGIRRYIEAGVPRNQYQYDTETGQITPYRSLELYEIIVAVAVSFGAGSAGIFIVLQRYRKQVTGYHYPVGEKGTLQLLAEQDTYLNKTVTRRRLQSSGGSGGGGGGGRSSTHTARSGRSHGGGSRRF